MGVAIRYCDRCRIRISPSDLESGKALEYRNKVYCRDCSEEIRPQVESDDKATQEVKTRRATRSTRRSKNPLVESDIFNPFQTGADEGRSSSPSPPSPRHPPRQTPRPVNIPVRRQGPSTRVTKAPEKKGLSPAVLALVGVGIAVVIAVVIISVSGFSRSAAKEDSGSAPSRPTPPPDRRAQADPRLEKAERAFNEATLFIESYPAELENGRKKIEAALPLCRATKYEEMLRSRLERINQALAEAGRCAFEAYERSVCEQWALRNFDEALAFTEGFKAGQEWMEKALALHAQVVDHRSIWALARSYPAGTSLARPNIAARVSLFGEFHFGLVPVPLDASLSGWTSAGSARFTASGDTLEGRTAAGEGGTLVHGEADWVDYNVSFEFQFLEEKGFSILVHAGDQSGQISVNYQGLQREKWYTVDLTVWGDFAFLYFYHRATMLGNANLRSCDRSGRGGFGFYLADGAAIAVRNIRSRRLSLPGRGYVPPPEGWHALHEPGRFVTGASVQAARETSGAWVYDDAQALFRAASEGGDLFLQLGSPSWTRYAFSMEARGLKKGLTFELRRPSSPRSLINGEFECAAFTFPEDLIGDDWKDVVVEASETDAVVTVAGVEAARAPFQAVEGSENTQPVRFGFAADQAGGALEFRNPRIRVTERKGGF